MKIECSNSGRSQMHHALRIAFVTPIIFIIFRSAFNYLQNFYFLPIMSPSDTTMSASDIALALTIVTGENPARGGDEMDWERSAFLHNYILERGWVGSGRDLADLDKRTWWEYHGEKAEALRPHLSPSLVKFFEHAWQGPDHDHSFFYYVNGLMPPGGLWIHNELEQGAIAGASLLTLYSANNIASHPVGLE